MPNPTLQNAILKQASIFDIKTIKQISEKTFFETFAHFNTKENIDNYLADNFNNEKLTSELNTINSFFYIIIVDNDVAGYLKLNVLEAQTEKNHLHALEIERIYILNKYHGKKLGKLLLNKAIEVAKKLSKSYIWLGVWEMNERAINFYKKNNFISIDKHIFKLGDDLQTDYIFKLMF